jgi:general secretion pathway protein B
MSFILDALKKSETDRQQQGSAEFSGVPTSAARREGPPAWLWIVGVLLLVNLAVLIGIFFRPDISPGEAALPAQVRPEPKPAVQEDDFAEQVAVARQNVPRREEPVAEPVAAPAIQSTARSAPRVTMANMPRNVAALPTVHEVTANGTLSLPELHVDIHVYSEVAKDRFVFINMAKHNEGSRLAEGPLVEEITPYGVVLSMNGTTFLLPRD